MTTQFEKEIVMTPVAVAPGNPRDNDSDREDTSYDEDLDEAGISDDEDLDADEISEDDLELEDLPEDPAEEDEM